MGSATGMFNLIACSCLDDETKNKGFLAEHIGTYKYIESWMKVYLAGSHPELGREGPVCPSILQAIKLDTLRIGVCDSTVPDVKMLKKGIGECFEALDDIPCSSANIRFRAVIVGFPRINTPQGVKAINSALNAWKMYSLVHGRMYILEYPDSDGKGIWNPNFRPHRSEIPLMVIRVMMINDTPFVFRRPLIAPFYLYFFALNGLKRLWKFGLHKMKPTL